MTYQGVTNAQLDHLKQMAKGKGVTREAFQKYGLDGGIIAQAMERMLEAGKPVVQAVSGLLRLITTISLPAVEKFIVSERFVSTDTMKLYLGDNFKKHFLPKVEEGVPARELAVHTLTKGAVDKDIRKELGNDREETTLAHLHELLCKQPKGEDGVLLVNGYANVLYIKDANGNLWAVGADWDASYGDWLVNAYSVGYPGGWGGGSRVVSRK